MANRGFQKLYDVTGITATPAPSADQRNNQMFRGLVAIITSTVPGAAPSTVFTIEGKDPVSGNYYTILASAAIVANGTTILRVYPGLVAAANLTVNDVLPLVWRIKAVHGNANAHTYTVAAMPIT